jgi:hypothetical protein
VSTNSWQNGVSGDWSTSSDWSNGSPSAGSTASITASGTYVVTLFGSGTAAALTLDAQGAEFYDAGALNLAGTLALQAGTLALAYGAINGGTLAMQGGSLLATGGTLNGVAVDGTLNMSAADSTLFVQNGLTLAGANGSGTGSIALNGAYDSLNFLGSQTINNAVIGIGSIGNQPGQTGPAALDITHAGGATSGATLTLGSSAWVRDGAGQAQLVVGTASPVVGATLPDALINQGTVTVSGVGGTLAIAGSGTFINQGTLAASNGSLLEISTAGFQSTGVINVTNATLGLGGTFATSLLSNLGKIALSNGQVEILGTARNTWSTLSIGAGSSITGSLGAIALAGTMAYGTVVDAGGGMSFAAGSGTLSGVTYQGVLALTGAASAVTFTGNTQLTSAGGNPGAASITGNAAALLLQGNDTLNKATLTLGASGQAASIGTSDAWLASTATTATLGTGLTVQQGGANAALNANGFSPIPGFGLADTLVNQGVINGAYAGGTLTIGGFGSFMNQGTIAISNGDMLKVSAEQFANAGTITVGAGGLAYLGGNANAFGAAPAWSNAGQIAVNGGTLVLGGSITTAQLGTITESAGQVQLTGTLNNAGNTITLGSAAAMSNVSLTGTILGGNITDPNAALSAGPGGTATLDGVTDTGTLSLGQSGAFLRVRDGLTLNGTANITGAGSVLDFVGSQSFTNAHVNLGAAGTAATLEVTHSNTTAGASVLTLGNGLGITQSGQYAAIGGPGGTAGDSIVNTGTITAGVYGGTLSIGGPGFTNQGHINVSNGETLSIGAAQFCNTGTIAVTNAQLALAGSLTMASLGQVSLNNASVAVSGTVSLGGGTLAIGQGSSIGRLSLTGTLAGGTIADGGYGLAGAGNADLSGVTYDGLLDLSRPFAQLAFSQGITLTGQNGSGTGSIALTGAAARLIASSTETLNNTNITLGSAAQTYLGQSLAAPELAAGAGAQLTIGAGSTINLVGSAGTLGDAGLGQWSDSIVNAGKISEAISGGTLTIGSTLFTNSGSLVATSGGVLIVGSAGFNNTGTMAVGAGSVVQLSLYDYFAAPVSGATNFTNQGTIAMGGGILHEMTANGLFPNVPIVNTAGATIIGTGAVMTPISNSGTIDAHGGTLSVYGAVAGTGSLQIDAGATLELATNVSAGQTVNFTSTSGTLKIDQPSTFAGQIGNLTGGDVIDLPGQTLTGVALNNGSLVLNTATNQYHIAATTPLTGAIEAGRDGHGGATIAIIPKSASGTGSAPTVLGVTQPNMLFWTAPAGDILQGSSANMSGTDVCNWSNASSLDITDLAPATAKLLATVNGNTTTLGLSDGTHSFNLEIGAGLSASHFTLTADGHGGTLITTH